MAVRPFDPNFYRPGIDQAERGRERDFGGVAADADSHQAVQRRLPRAVEQPPTPVQIGLEYGVEVGRREAERITGHKAGRYAERATERDAKMRKITADAGPLD